MDGVMGEVLGRGKAQLDQKAQETGSAGDETAEAADIDDLFGDNDEMCALWDPQERGKYQIAPV